MVINKKYKGLIDEGYRYKIEGDIETTEGLETDLDKGLYVTGYIKAGGYIEAGGSIEAGWYIEAGGSIKAGRYIKAGGLIEAGGSIEAGWYIEAGGSIKAGRYIEAGGWIETGGDIKAGGSIKAGEYSGIVAGLSITCKGELSFGLRLFAGTCPWRNIEDEDKTITCGKLVNGIIEYGILKETGIEETDDKTEEAIALLKEKGYRIVKS
jgi:hypothetical protein